VKRRHVLAAGIGALAAPSIARANKFPDRTIRLIVPFPAGGATDIVGRMFADKLTRQLGQTVIVDNKSGAAGSIGAMEVRNAKPDGYTLLVATSSTHAINPTAFVNPPYDPVKDFTPITSVCVNPLVFYANPSMPPTMMELVKLMKDNPGKYSYGSTGFGSIVHLAAEYLKRSVGGMDVVHVPYKGGAPAIQDTIAGRDRAGDPDHDRGWRQGLPSLHVQPDPGTAWHAEGRGRHARQGEPPGHDRSRHRQVPRGQRRHSDAGHHAGTHGAVHQGRTRQVGTGDPRRKRQDHLAASALQRRIPAKSC
jgi:hypothetical protein